MKRCCRLSLVAAIASFGSLVASPAGAAVINVTAGSASALRSAMAAARAGDTLVLTGNYNLGNTGITTAADGNAAAPITIRASAAGATLVGNTSGSGIAINHDYWVVQGLAISGFQKSVRIDGANHGVLSGLRCFGSSGEAVKLRNSSQFWLISNCRAENTGAEGFYLGDADQNWEGGTVDRTGNVTLVNCYAFATTNDAFDFKEGTQSIKVVDCSADFGPVVPGANALGNSFIYSRANGLQVMNFAARGNASTGNVVRAHRLTGVDGIGYGSGNEIYNVSATDIAGAFLYNRHPDTRLYSNYSLTNVAGGLLESGSLQPGFVSSESFVEMSWQGVGGGRFFFPVIPEPGAAVPLMSALAWGCLRRRRGGCSGH